MNSSTATPRSPGRLFLLVFVSSPIFSARIDAQGQPAAILGKTADNAAAGALGGWDFGSSDLAFKAAKNEIWVVDAYDEPVPFINIFTADDLSSPPRRIPIALPAEFAAAPVLGLSEIHAGPPAFIGKNLVLIDPTFGTQDPPQPLFGVFDDNGKQVAGTDFAPTSGVDPTARLSSIDASPTEALVAAYDNANHAFYILDLNFEKVLGPVPALGFSNSFASLWFFGSADRAGLRGGGMGIAYNGPDRLLITSGFLNAFETHLALEYDLTKDGAFSGRSMDLGAAGLNGLNPDLAFLGMDSGKVGPDDALFALNVGDDSVYAFRVLTYPDAPPVQLTNCSTDDTGLYQVSWALDATFSVDSFRIFENGVEVATLPPTVNTFQSPRPLLGKAFLEVVTEKGGILSSLRPVCQVENTQTPRLAGVTTDGAQINNLGLMTAVAVTKLPAKAEDFRGYVMGLDTNSVEVIDYTLSTIEVLSMDPPVVTQGRNLAALGVALVHLEGQDRLAILDSDGPLDNNIPSVSIYSLDPPNRGQLFLQVAAIDFAQISPAPFLYDWDADDQNNFVAGGVISATGDLVLVRIEFDGTNMVATQMAPVPQRLLTPYDDLLPVGVGVSILPSGNLLVAGADTFSKTYTEAILTTPFTDDPSTSVKIVGYAQGLPVSNQFFGFGPDIGPTVIYGMDTAFFPPEEGREEGIGVTYLPAGRLDEIANPATRQILGFRGNILIHSENACSHPDLKAEQLAEATLDVLAGQVSSTAPVTPSFTGSVASSDFFLYVMNQSKTAEAKLSLEVKLDGAIVAEGNQKALLGPGRYLRIALTGRPERSIALSVGNEGAGTASVKVIVGAMGIGGTPARPAFRRGDCNGDASIQLTDAVVMLNWLFKGGAEPSCIDACDADDNGTAGLTDPIIILNYLFKGGPKPATPGPLACGEDPTTDDSLKPCVYPPTSCQ